MCNFSNKKLAKFTRKRTKYEFFMILLGAKQHSNEKNEKNKPSSWIVMILQYTKNLELNFVLQDNEAGLVVMRVQNSGAMSIVALAHALELKEVWL